MINRELGGLLAALVVMSELAKRQQGEPKQDSQRGTGRSTSLALKQAQAAMDAAARGSAIEIYDHHDKQESHIEQANRVSAVLRALNVEHTVCGNVIDVEPRKSQQEEQQLPEWAVGLNTDLQLVPGAQLLTRNGRRCGNAGITCVHEEPHGIVYCAVTDAGNSLRLSKEEVDELFEVGDYLMDPAEIAARQK